LTNHQRVVHTLQVVYETMRLQTQVTAALVAFDSRNLSSPNIAEAGETA
jgi:hypothetical protein